jgi:hypothetical protein
MSCPDCPDAAAIDAIDAAVLAAAAGPASVTVDGMTTQMRPAGDLIAQANYARSRCAASGPRRGLRLSRLIPPGGV